MDIATIVGILLGSGLVAWAIISGAGDKAGAFFDPASITIVVGGSIGAAFMSFPLRNLTGPRHHRTDRQASALEIDGNGEAAARDLGRRGALAAPDDGVDHRQEGDRPAGGRARLFRRGKDRDRTEI